MTAPPLSPVIPRSGTAVSKERAGRAAARRLPLARPVVPPPSPEGVVYGLARIDPSGRLCERAVVAALGWSGGDLLTLTAGAGVVTARRDAGGMVELPPTAFIPIPAALRRRCGLVPGDQVMLAALPGPAAAPAHSMTTTTEHTTTPAADHPAAAGQDPLASLREASASARTEAGRLLACLRHTAGFSQAQLAGRIGYSATAVAHAELGIQPVSAEFWELADDALTASGKLTAQGARIQDLATARREEQHRQHRARHARHLAQLLSRPHGEDGTVSVVPAAPAPAVTTPAVGRCPHCNQPVALVTHIAAPPDTGTGQQPGTGGLADPDAAHSAGN